MKKRIFMLALVVGVILSVCASAWADSQSVAIDKNIPGYTTVNNVNNTSGRIGRSFTISVKAGLSGHADETHSTNAKYLKWTVTQVDANGDTTGTLPVADLAITSVNGTNDETNGALDEVTISEAPSTFSANVTGTIQATGTVTVTVALVQEDKSTAATMTGYDGVLTMSKTITFAATDAEDERTTDTTLFTDSSDNPDLFDTYDAADPDSVEWNGLDPTFSNTINKTSYDIGKNKPKLGKIEKANLTFTPGTAKDLTVPMLGPIELVDVYIAQKDAKKLYPASADSISGNIRLTSASIKAYKIPFRVTSYDFAKTVTGSTTKEIQKAWKSAENSLTLAFNGSKMQYKGFPLTIEMSNSNNTSKPTKKAIKLNIGSDFTTPAWTYKVTSYDTTTDEEIYTEWETDEDTVEDSTGEVHTYTSDGAAIDLTNEDNAAIKAASDDADANGVFTVTAGETTTTYIVSTDNKVYLAKDLEHYYYRYVYVTKTVDKKDKLEASTWVNDSAAGTADDPKTGEIEKIYYASADAPYAITAKPDPAKDSTKITKFFAAGYSVDIHQPVYDYLGNVKTHGYVRLAGSPTETSKESKLAFTFTATNPSTKKKGAAKVTANAKTFPDIDKISNVTITAAQQADWDGAYDYDYYVTREGSTAEDGSITYKRATVKRVEAGKVPSVKVKAKGSKTISYKLGKYTVEDGEPVATDEDGNDFSTFNAAMLANLKALKLSFDEKKGAVVLLDKSDKATKPTLNSDGDAFESLDIVITAVNNVGYDQAWAHVAITGAKPKMADKSVTVEGTKQTGDTITFKVLAGKDAAEGKTDGSANVKVYAADSTAAKTLSDYGLALVPYDSMDVIVSAEVTFEAGATIPAYDEEKNPIVKGDDYSYENDSSTDGTTDAAVMYIEATGSTAAYYKAGSAGVTLLSGDTWAKSADTSLKNYGILQVIDPEALAKVSKDKTANKGVSVNLTLENLGATNKGKLKVIIKDTVDGGDPLDPVVTATTSDSDSSSSESSETTTGAAPKTNGTASLTYNGALPEDADAEEAAKGTVTFGEPRTVADLTAGQQAFLAEKGYTVVAVLPKITADVSDQYKLENIELDEDAPEGATLIWIAFPKNAPASEDDEIVDFYDEAGTPVEGVPASHKIIAEPWLREAVTYEPVIAIEAK